MYYELLCFFFSNFSLTLIYVKTIDEVTNMIRQHELEEKVKFYIYKEYGEFTNHTQPLAGIHTYNPIPLSAHQPIVYHLYKSDKCLNR